MDTVVSPRQRGDQRVTENHLISFRDDNLPEGTVVTAVSWWRWSTTSASSAAMTMPTTATAAWAATGVESTSA